MHLIIIQTSDAFNYYRMLRATSRTAIEYCRRHNHAYECFIGVKRGYYPAQATFNRIFMLEDLINRGHRDWVLYMDADAYIYDLDFDLNAYLSDKLDRSAILATIPGETIPWHINAGVFFLNLGHSHAIELCHEWRRRFMKVPDERLKNLVSVWDHENDQMMLYEALDQDPAIREPVYFEDATVFNHHEGRFVRQFLHALDPNIDTRTATIEAAVRDIFNKVAPGGSESAEQRVVRDFYRAILRREPDPESRVYVEYLQAHGLEAGAAVVVRELLNSEEYRNIQR